MKDCLRFSRTLDVPFPRLRVGPVWEDIWGYWPRGNGVFPLPTVTSWAGWDIPRRRYIWRVDEIKVDGSIVKGDIWSFSTGGLVGWWKLDGNSDDSSGAELHGEEMNNPKYAAGIHGQALALSDKKSSRPLRKNRVHPKYFTT